MSALGVDVFFVLNILPRHLDVTSRVMWKTMAFQSAPFRVHFSTSKEDTRGGAEFAGQENEGQRNFTGWKMQDWKRTDKSAGLDNAGLENGGQHCRGGKCRTRSSKMIFAVFRFMMIHIALTHCYKLESFFLH